MATKVPGGFVPLYMHYLRDPAIRRAGPDAELLYIRGLAYAKANQTDGIIYDFDLDVVAVGLTKVHPRVSALIREKLWTKTDDGWRIRSWPKWNKTGDEIAVEKQQKSEAAILANHARWHQEKIVAGCPHCQADARIRAVR